MSLKRKKGGAPRDIEFMTRGTPASDGAGVRLTRNIGTPELDMADPFLPVAGRRLNEPVARGGPLVMNTRAEDLQAFHDYHTDRF